MNNYKLLRTGAVAAWVSSLLLVVMAFIVFPQGLEYPGLPFLTGKVSLSEAEASGFFHSLNIIFVLDGLFLTGWIVSWTAVSKLVISRDRLTGILVFLLGIGGAVLDFSENSLIYGIVRTFKTGNAPGGLVVTLWNAVRHMSYWFPYIGAAFLLFAFPVKRKAVLILLVFNGLLTLFAIIGLYIPGFFIISNAWFLFLFLQLGIILWKSSNKGNNK